MHFLVISKLPEFTPEGEVIPGQCEPYTGGWRLKLIVDGTAEEILAGTYYEIRRVQRRCIGKSADETRKLASEAAKAMNAAQQGGPSGDDGNESTQILGMDEVRRAMLEMELTTAIDDLDENAEWLKVSERDGVAVVSLGAGVESVDAKAVLGAIGRAFDSGESAFVVDLGDRGPAGDGFPGHLRDLAARARERGRFLGVVGASDDLRSELDGDSSEDAPLFFANLEGALSAAAEARETEDVAGPSSDGLAGESQGE